MQGIEKIAYQNACRVALERARTTGTTYYVIPGEAGQLAVTDEDPGPGAAVYTARVDGLEAAS